MTLPSPTKPLFFLLLVIFVAVSFAAHAGSAASPSTTTEGPDFINPDSENPYKGLVPRRYLEEADQFKKTCQADSVMRLYYDCACLSFEFLNKRMEVGDSMSANNIQLELEKKCPDATEAAGQEYLECLGTEPMLPIEIDSKKYCECVANTYAKLYEAYSPGPTSKAFVEIRTEALLTCRDPQLAKRMYPESPVAKPR